MKDFKWCVYVRVGGTDIMRFAFCKVPLATRKKTDCRGSILEVVRQCRSLRG